MRGREIELDFIRGLAILMVLDYHSPSQWMSRPLHWLGFPNIGWIGVDVFFVLSGFLVGGLLIKEHKLAGQVDAKRFLVRRAFKVWPQYYFYLAVMLITGHRALQDLWGNLLNVQNYAGGIPHTWSLAVEEHAYLFLVACLVVFSWADISMRTLFWSLAIVSACVTTSRGVLIELGHEVVTKTHTRVEGIFYGVMLAIVYHHSPGSFRALQRNKWVWLCGLSLAFLYLRFASPAPWAQSLGWDMANLIGVCLLMVLYRPISAGNVRSLPYRIVSWIGLYSYGIYLWHVSVLGPTEAISSRLPPWIRPIWLGVGPIVAGIALGALLTRIVEFPALKLRDLWFPRRVATTVGFPASVQTGLQEAAATCDVGSWTLPEQHVHTKASAR